jgi:hypothetical protein
MRRRASFRWLVVLPALLLAGCTDDDAGPVRAASPAVAPGPAAISATVRAGDVRYRLRGTWDPTVGYRVCARIEEAPRRYFDRRVLWLEGRNGMYGTLTAHGRRCRREKGDWFDDHPPTLGLFDLGRWPLQGRPGAEDYLHAALLALGGLPGRTVDFRSFDREPPRRDEDGWTLRPLLRRLGTRNVQVGLGPGGLVERLRLVGPRRVEVVLSLSDHGERHRVPHAIAYGIE